MQKVATAADALPLADALGLAVVATNDVHYCYEEDAAAQDILVCVQTNATVNDAKRLKELEAENARLKKLVANQALDIDMLKEISSGNF